MAARVVDAQETVGRQLHIQIGAGDDQARHIAVLVPLRDASGELARIVVAQHDAMARVGREDVILSHRQPR